MHYGKIEKMDMQTMEKYNQCKDSDRQGTVCTEAYWSSHEFKGETQGVEWATHVYT